MQMSLSLALKMTFILSPCLFLGLCNKILQTEWLKTTGIYAFTVLEARSWKSRWWQGHAPSETIGGNPSLPFPRLLGPVGSSLAIVGWQLCRTHLCLYHHVLSVCLSLQGCVLIRTPVVLD